MKVAILLSGQPRNVQVAYDTLNQHYLKNHECDFFIHTWYGITFPSDVYGEMIKLFEPKKYLIEKQIKFDKVGITDPRWGTTLQNLMSMYYSIYMANQLRYYYEIENDFKYDFVMRMRTDLKINRPIELEKIEKDKLALYKWTETHYDNIGYSDVFAIGNSDIMNKYASVYENIPYYLNDDKTYNIPDTKMRPEYVLRHHIETVNKIPVQHFWHGDATDCSFNLIR